MAEDQSNSSKIVLKKEFKMKKKHRNIIVNGNPYAWTYHVNSGDGGDTSVIKIWKNKKVIYKTKVDYTISKEVTPAYIAELITTIEE